MRAFTAVVLINLALGVGAGWGYLFWGVRAARLERDLAVARAAAVSGVEREWRVEGVVRAILPEIGVLVLTHGEIAGYMPPMTMGFRAASPKITESVRVGDAVRLPCGVCRLTWPSPRSRRHREEASRAEPRRDAAPGRDGLRARPRRRGHALHHQHEVRLRVDHRHGHPGGCRDHPAREGQAEPHRLPPRPQDRLGRLRQEPRPRRD